MKTVPKHVIGKVNRMSDLMQKIMEINSELEDWLESSGVTDYGFDFTGDFREASGYEIYDQEGFYRAIESKLNGGE